MSELTPQQVDQDCTIEENTGRVINRYGDQVLPNGQIVFKESTREVYSPKIIKALLLAKVQNAITPDAIAELAHQVFNTSCQTGITEEDGAPALKFRWYSDISDELTRYAVEQLNKQLK